MANIQFQIRRGTAAQWTTANPTLAAGELGLETDTSRLKVGNGSNAWTSLPYFGIRLTDFSVVNAGGEGTLSYNNTTGVFTYTGPTATDFRSLFSAGTGVSIVNGQISIGQAVGPGDSVTFNSIQHQGITLTSGTNVDQILSFTKSLTLTTDWQDTGIKNNDLATGTYIVQLYANDTGAGGSNSNEYYSGTMSWYSGSTNSSTVLPTDEIVLHRAGGSGEADLYLRTFRSAAVAADDLRLQIYSNQSNASAANYIFKFRRMI
jgi:hypothetical protein